MLFAGSASRALANAVASEFGHPFAVSTIERFPDGEVLVCLDEPVCRRQVILLAATAPPVNDHLVELLALADACRRADAARIVAFMPYFGYARSDRRDGRRTPIMASLVAELTERAGIDHVVAVDVHTPAVEGFFRIAVDNLTAVPVLAAALQKRVSADTVIVAPDLGALRLANRYATQLGLPVAVCHKRRLGGAEVSIGRITGDVVGRPCVIIDDMISTGGTIAESVRALNEAGARRQYIVAATHAVLVPGALEKITDAGVVELFVTDSIEPRGDGDTRRAPTVVSIAPLLANAIGRLIEGGSLRDLS